MKKQELVGAYLEGRIDRRRFVRSLVAGGVTATAAVTYADVLAAGASGPLPRTVALSTYPTTGNDEDGKPVQIGRVNNNRQFGQPLGDPGGPTVISGKTAPQPGYPPRVAMIWGEQQAAGQFGLQGSATNTAGIGVVATSAGGASLVLSDSSVGIPPLGGGLAQFWDTGAFVVNGGHVWYCYASGTGISSKWVKLSSTLVTLAAPSRVFDSRVGQPNPSGSTQGVFTVGAAGRPINCAPAIPTGVPAATFLFNVTLANTVGAVGSVLVWANGATEPNAASVTWTGSGTVIANAVTSGCDGAQKVQVKCTTGSQTHVILDVVGYYL